MRVRWVVVPGDRVQPDQRHCNPCGVATTDFQQSQAAAAVLLITVVAFAIGELAQAVRGLPQARVRHGSRHADLRGEVVFRLVFLTGILLLPLAESIAPGAAIPGDPMAFVVGVVVAWLGLLLRWWSFLTLGRYFSFVLTTSPEQTIVDRGPYRVLRHPSYTGLLLAVLGCALMVGNWVGLVTSSVAVVAAIVYRIRIEERALTETIGERYRDFATSRARLVPFVW